MAGYGYTMMQVLTQLPTLLVLLTGLVLAGSARRRLPRPSRRLMYAGLGVLLLDAGLGIGVSFALPRLIEGGMARESSLSPFQLLMTVAVASYLLHPVGLGLLVASALTGRRTPEPLPAWDGWTPPPAGPPVPAGGGAPTSTADFPPLPVPAADAVVTPAPGRPDTAGSR